MARSPSDASKRAAIRECAASLPFSVDELDFEGCLATADALESAAETLYSSDALRKQIVGRTELALRKRSGQR
jgi:hypothetical protein